MILSYSSSTYHLFSSTLPKSACCFQIRLFAESHPGKDRNHQSTTSRNDHQHPFGSMITDDVLLSVLPTLQKRVQGTVQARAHREQIIRECPGIQPITESIASTIKRDGHSCGAFVQMMFLFFRSPEPSQESSCIQTEHVPGRHHCAEHADDPVNFILSPRPPQEFHPLRKNRRRAGCRRWRYIQLKK